MLSAVVVEQSSILSIKSWPTSLLVNLDIDLAIGGGAFVVLRHGRETGETQISISTRANCKRSAFFTIFAPRVMVQARTIRVISP